MGQVTLADWCSEWLQSVALTRPKSLVFYRAKLRHVLPLLGETELSALTAADIRRMLATLQESGLSATMLSHVRRTLHTTLAAAVSEGLLPRHPMRGLRVPPRADYEARTLTVEQAQRLVTVARDHPLGPLITVALATGMRQGELLALTWDDVDLSSGEVRVSKSVATVSGGHRLGGTKTSSGRRRVTLDAGLLTVLEEQRRRCARLRLQAHSWEDLGLVFPNHCGGYQTPSGSFVRQFRRLLSRAACPCIRFHDLRHTAGLFMTRQVGVVVTSRVLGHHSPAFTASVYGHAQVDDFRHAAVALSRTLGLGLADPGAQSYPSPRSGTAGAR